MDKVSKDIKLNIAKDITNAYVSSHNKDNDNKLSVDDVCEAFKKIYSTVDKTIPDDSSRKIGLGV
ncbi:MAG: hypothetical protein AB7V50_11315 [Vampirovibrionia bacterium]